MRILVLPGMGDIYWVFVKLESFLERNNITTIPEIYTWELQSHKINRSADYIMRVPFVKYEGSFIYPQNVPEFNDLYFGTSWIKPNFRGFDYVLSCNGILRNGYNLDSFGLDAYNTNWYFKLVPSEAQQITKDNFSTEKYIIAYFTDDGMYSQTWLKYLPLQTIYQILSEIASTTGYKIYLTGSNWDIAFNQKLKCLDIKNQFVNLVGTTTIDNLFGLIESSQAMIGWCGGNTIMSTYFKKRTMIIWSKYFQHEQFYKYSCPPDSLNKWYNYTIAEQTNSHDIVSRMISLCGVEI